MRIENLNWAPANKQVKAEARKRAIRAGNLLVNALRQPGVCPVGTREHPMYKKGKYKDQPWTKLDKGSLKKSIRNSPKKDSNASGQIIEPVSREVLVIAGNYFAWYAAITEYYKAWFRPTVEKVRPEINSILEGK